MSKITAGLTTYGTRIWSTGDDVTREDVARLKKARNLAADLNAMGKKPDDAWQAAVKRITGCEVNTRMHID